MDFVDIQIDHIVPRSLSKEQIAELLARLGIEDEFDVDDPYNLAPICARCNGPAGKSGRDLLHLPVEHASTQLGGAGLGS